MEGWHDKVVSFLDFARLVGVPLCCSPTADASLLCMMELSETQRFGLRMDLSTNREKPPRFNPGIHTDD
jgi:hypothetical protein